VQKKRQCDRTADGRCFSNEGQKKEKICNPQKIIPVSHRERGGGKRMGGEKRTSLENITTSGSSKNKCGKRPNGGEKSGNDDGVQDKQGGANFFTERGDKARGSPLE